MGVGGGGVWNKTSRVKMLLYIVEWHVILPIQICSYHFK